MKLKIHIVCWFFIIDLVLLIALKTKNIFYQAVLGEHANTLFIMIFLYIIIIGYFEALFFTSNKEKFYNSEIKDYGWHPKIGIQNNFFKYTIILSLWHFFGILAIWHYHAITKSAILNDYFGMLAYEFFGILLLIFVLKSKFSKTQFSLNDIYQKKKEIEFSDETLSFNVGLTKSFRWKDIKHLFFWENSITKDSFVIIDNENQATLITLNQKYDETIKNCLKKWYFSLKNDAPTVFEYPKWVLNEEKKKAKRWKRFFAIFVLLAIVLICLNFLTNPISQTIIKPVVGLLLFSCLIISKFIKIKVTPDRVILNNDNLEIIFSDNTKRAFNYESLVELSENLNNSYLAVKDLGLLKNIERLSYFPVLQEHLLSKIKANSKTDTLVENRS